MDKFVMDLMKNGKDINDVLDMPYHYVVQLLDADNKPKQQTSLIAAFGGSSPRE